MRRFGHIWGDAPKILQPAEHAFDCVWVSIEERREAVLPFAIGLGRDVGHDAVAFDLAADVAGVIALVRM